jgi:hypothetical protein
MRRLALMLCALALWAPAKADAGLTIAGFSSWYGGPCDGYDNNRTASGMPNTVPGFATRWVPFGRWFVVTEARSGRRALGMSLERGPAVWTGRVIDLNYTLAGRLGYPLTRGGCVLGYPNGWVVARQVVVGLRYPSCGWAARRAGYWLRQRVGRLGRPGNCLHGRAATRMRRWQRSIGRPRAGRRRALDLGTWRALYRAR